MRPLHGLVMRIYRSAWFVVALRAFAVAVALVTLAWVGRSASADPAPLSPHGAPLPSSTVVDAGAGAPPPAPAAPPPAPAPQGPASRGRASPADPVFINDASADELRRLPGVGPKRAEAILVLRRRLGRFHRVEDLMRVKGVGRASVRKWRPLVRLDAPPAAQPAADAGSP